MSRWFRHYAGMARDDKLVRIAIRTHTPIERVVWIWCAILESAAEIDDNGQFDIDEAEIAYFLRCEPSKIGAVVQALADCGHVTGCNVTAWEKRQFKSDRSNERVARHRAKKASAAQENGVNATTEGCNVTVTPHRQRQKQSIIPEANASGQASPPRLSAAAMTKAIFDTGTMLLKATGHDDRSARSIIGRWRKTYSDGSVLTALSRCEAMEPPASEPIEWITKALQAEQHRAAGQAPPSPQSQRASVSEIGARLASGQKRIAHG